MCNQLSYLCYLVFKMLFIILIIECVCLCVCVFHWYCYFLTLWPTIYFGRKYKDAIVGTIKILCKKQIIFPQAASLISMFQTALKVLVIFLFCLVLPWDSVSFPSGPYHQECAFILPRQHTTKNTIFSLIAGFLVYSYFPSRNFLKPFYHLKSQ